ncbi:carboxypeptidase-like regulatory domain-containing protein [Chryseobacterium gotjawalense]|uniref:Carboxypeptidase-like regulatory domain-containing protein n=1 Tax=Chryseobacterium gotjawalense TaxID=3042315 RepID=A0ABY8R9W8_9FLAO|nr:carboxypeptidase-like regulatory domain-containing protein [Chryseobacterium sp. wdc7]WHF50479.1 carboxypeptidase-like regulatory domain-containing protein [Chryseobacterium sp. wdc7]
MVRIILLFALCFSASLFSQQVSGTVTDEEKSPLPAVLVFNMKTEQKTYTNLNGEFTIEASVNSELRFIRQGFERRSKVIRERDFTNPLIVSILRIPGEIEEVKIAYKPIGDLNKDLKNYGDTKSVKKLKGETAKYIRSESTEEVLAPKSGEFVQPVGQGFFIGGPNSQWDDVDFMQFLIENLGNDFFTDDLQLNPSEIQPFIYYVFQNFERREVLFRGICTQYDLSRFIKEAISKLEVYRKNLPNVPPKKKKNK